MSIDNLHPNNEWYEELLVLRDPLPPLPLDSDLNSEEFEK